MAVIFACVQLTSNIVGSEQCCPKCQISCMTVTNNFVAEYIKIKILMVGWNLR